MSDREPSEFFKQITTDYPDATARPVLQSDPQQLREKIAREIVWGLGNDHPVSALMDAIIPIVSAELAAEQAKAILEVRERLSSEFIDHPQMADAMGFNDGIRHAQWFLSEQVNPYLNTDKTGEKP